MQHVVWCLLDTSLWTYCGQWREEPVGDEKHPPGVFHIWVHVRIPRRSWRHVGDFVSLRVFLSQMRTTVMFPAPPTAAISSAGNKDASCSDSEFTHTNAHRLIQTFTVSWDSRVCVRTKSRKQQSQSS